jgi:hypothetical protein
VGAIELTALLWREREAVQAVLERQQEFLEALRVSDRGSVARAETALEDVVDRLRPVVLLRDIEVAAVADEWGVLTELSLATLPRFAPPGPWGGIFADHLKALRDLATRSVALGREIDDQLASRAIPAGVRLPVRPESYSDPGGDQRQG